jgi:hypothetical protein
MGKTERKRRKTEEGKNIKRKGETVGIEIILGFSNCTVQTLPRTSLHFADWLENISTEWSIKKL